MVDFHVGSRTAGAPLQASPTLRAALQDPFDDAVPFANVLAARVRLLAAVAAVLLAIAAVTLLVDVGGANAVAPLVSAIAAFAVGRFSRRSSKAPDLALLHNVMEWDNSTAGPAQGERSGRRTTGWGRAREYLRTSTGPKDAGVAHFSVSGPSFQRLTVVRLSDSASRSQAEVVFKKLDDATSRRDETGVSAQLEELGRVGAVTRRVVRIDGDAFVVVEASNDPPVATNSGVDS